MNIKKFYTKACIIGAGPSGSATAIFLGKYQIPNIIIDVAKFPRDKVCGDGLDLKAIGILNQIDPKIIQNNIHKDGVIKPCWGFRLIHQNGKNTEFVFSPNSNQHNKPPYAVCKRIDFDNLLLEYFDKRYTTFFNETQATSIEKTEDGWKVSAKHNNYIIEIYCNVLVGADGERSLVLKTVGERKINRDHYAGGVRQYWKGIKGLHEKNLMEIYYPKLKPMSYLWIFPFGNGFANVGYGMLSSVAAKNNFNIKNDFAKLLENDPILQERFIEGEALDHISGWGLPLASLQRKCFGDGWLLVGDAASMISPTTGEGVGTGMTTGLIAAKFIQNAVTLNDFSESSFRNYDREIYRRVIDDIKLFNLSMKISPKMMTWVMNNIIRLSIFKYLFQKKVGHWLKTAYSKDLVVNID